MKRIKILVFASVLCVAAAAFAANWSAEVLVLTTATSIPRVSSGCGFELQNNGPNPIYCVVGGDGVGGPPVYPDAGLVLSVGSGRQIVASGGAWSADIPGVVPVWCMASTAAQVHGAATIYTEAVCK